MEKGRLRAVGGVGKKGMQLEETAFNLKSHTGFTINIRR